jgi:hypothetical protein
MKCNELFKQLRQLGWHPTGNGSKHEKWTNGIHTIAVPRHKELNGKTAHKLIQRAELNNTNNLQFVFR